MYFESTLLYTTTKMVHGKPYSTLLLKHNHILQNTTNFCHGPIISEHATIILTVEINFQDLAVARGNHACFVIARLLVCKALAYMFYVQAWLYG